jgi:hypothetical protein
MSWTSLRQFWSNNTCVNAHFVNSFSSPEKPCALFSTIPNFDLNCQIPFLEGFNPPFRLQQPMHANDPAKGLSSPGLPFH